MPGKDAASRPIHLGPNQLTWTLAFESIDDTSDSCDHGIRMTTLRLTFPGASGAQLAARLELPAGQAASAYALFAHCFTCSKDLKAAVNISRELTHNGIGVLRFDFTGIGESEGEFADTNFSSNVDDLVAACEFLSGDYQAPRILIGHSLGGAAVLQAAGRLPSVRAVVTIGAPYDPAHLTHLFDEAEDELLATGEVEVTIAGRPFRLKRQFVEDLEAARMEGIVGKLDRALLVMHSPIDSVVDIENAARIYAAAKHPKSFVSLDSADHLLSSPADSRYAARVIGAWVSRYVDEEYSHPN
jgi:alpha/beta superfamily hydrolase